MNYIKNTYHLHGITSLMTAKTPITAFHTNPWQKQPAPLPLLHQTKVTLKHLSSRLPENLQYFQIFTISMLRDAVNLNYLNHNCLIIDAFLKICYLEIPFQLFCCFFPHSPTHSMTARITSSHTSEGHSTGPATHIFKYRDKVYQKVCETGLRWFCLLRKQVNMIHVVESPENVLFIETRWKWHPQP